MNKKSYTDLDQFDNEDGDYESLSDISNILANKLGEFLIIFSGLDHAINLIISDMISDRSHDVGYRMLTTLRMKNKIDFLYSILLNFISVTDQNKRSDLQDLKTRLENINSFRNKAVHANWGTLKASGDVRTKILTDNTDGSIKFENVRITEEILEEAIQEVDRLINEIDDFFMETQNAILHV